MWTLGGVADPGGGCTPLVHVGPHTICGSHFYTPLEHSRTFWYPTKIPEPFRYLWKPLSLYESYSPDSSGTPRDVYDLIRDSESPFVYSII